MDLYPDNILWEKSSEKIYFIDYEDICKAPFLVDVLTTLLFSCSSKSERENLVSAYFGKELPEKSLLLVVTKLIFLMNIKWHEEQEYREAISHLHNYPKNPLPEYHFYTSHILIPKNNPTPTKSI